MNKSVNVTAKDGTVVQKSKNPKYGYIRVTQDRLVTENGFAKTKTLSALIPGELETLNKFGWEDGQEVEGIIRIIESLTPVDKNNADAFVKMAGESGIPCMVGDQPIYRKNEFDFDSSSEDVLIQHDNVDAIREAFEAARETVESHPGDTDQMEV